MFCYACRGLCFKKWYAYIRCGRYRFKLFNYKCQVCGFKFHSTLYGGGFRPGNKVGSGITEEKPLIRTWFHLLKVIKLHRTTNTFSSKDLIHWSVVSEDKFNSWLQVLVDRKDISRIEGHIDKYKLL